MFAICIVSTMQAQNYKELLIGKTWRLSSLKMDEQLYDDSSNTCIYRTEIYFQNDSTLTITTPCDSLVAQKSFKLINDTMVIVGKEVLQILAADSLSFETSQMQEQTQVNGVVNNIDMRTIYTKKQ